jgi:hypothetical protein
MSLRDELLIPFRGAREAGRELVSGSVVLCRCIGRGLRRGVGVGLRIARQGETAADRLESLGVAALAGVVGGVAVVIALRGIVAVAAPYKAPIGGVLAVGWVVAAWMVPPEKGSQQPPVKIIKEGSGATPPPERHLSVGLVAQTIRRIATAGGWKGAHLDDVLAHLPGHSRTELLAVLADAKIPVAEQLKLTLPGGRQRNRQGVRLTALREGLGEAPPGPAAGAHQPAAEAPAQPLPDPPLTVL